MHDAFRNGEALKLFEEHRFGTLDVHDDLALEDEKEPVLIRVFVKRILTEENPKANDGVVHRALRLVEPRFVREEFRRDVDELQLPVFVVVFSATMVYCPDRAVLSDVVHALRSRCPAKLHTVGGIPRDRDSAADECQSVTPMSNVSPFQAPHDQRLRRGPTRAVRLPQARGGAGVPERRCGASGLHRSKSHDGDLQEDHRRHSGILSPPTTSSLKSRAPAVRTTLRDSLFQQIFRQWSYHRRERQGVLIPFAA